MSNVPAYDYSALVDPWPTLYLQYDFCLDATRCTNERESSNATMARAVVEVGEHQKRLALVAQGSDVKEVVSAAQDFLKATHTLDCAKLSVKDFSEKHVKVAKVMQSSSYANAVAHNAEVRKLRAAANKQVDDLQAMKVAAALERKELARQIMEAVSDEAKALIGKVVSVKTDERDRVLEITGPITPGMIVGCCCYALNGRSPAVPWFYGTVVVKVEGKNRYWVAASCESENETSDSMDLVDPAYRLRCVDGYNLAPM